MKFNVKTTKPESEKLDALVLGVFEGEKKLSADVAAIDKAMGGMIAEVVSGAEFTGKAGSHVLLPTMGKIGARRLLLLGMGKRASFKLDSLRQAAGRAAQLVRDYKFKTAGAPLADHAGAAFPARLHGQTLAEGILMALYDYGAYKTEREDAERPVFEAVTLFAPAAETAALKAGLADGERIAEAVALTRDLVSAPGSDMTPTILANRAKEMADKQGIKCQVLDEKAIDKLKMGALLGVARGAMEAQPPRFIVLEYLPVKGRKPLVFVGKGITFDSGGISIKPADGMDKMKYDMAGAGAVIGALKAIASLELPVNVVGLIPATENMPGGHAMHPGDILKTMSGKTIEVINTDAEGRLILADALSYAERYQPEVVLDLATLTGACVIALGNQAIGLMGNDQGLVDQILAAGERTWERAWQLPLWEEYSEQIKSDIADVKNGGGRPAGTITAAAMLAKFTGAYRWAHLDIAGTAWEDKGRAYVPKGATGIGVRLLVDLAREYAKGGKAMAAGTSAAASAASNGKVVPPAKPAAKVATGGTKISANGAKTGAKTSAKPAAKPASRKK